VRPGGHVVVGEGFEVPGQASHYFLGQTLGGNLHAFEAAGLAVVTFIRSSPDDFDTYHSIQATSLLDWIEENPSDPEVERWQREAVERIAERPFGWGLIAGRKPL
jgi:hypothetical protein